MAQITCRFCGVTVESIRQGQTRCGSTVCKRLYQREATALYRARVAVARPPKACRECGALFDAEPRNKRYCSEPCARAAHLRGRNNREYRPAAKSCDHCGGEIPYKSGKKRYCSPECQKAGIAKEAKWRVKGLPPSIVVSQVCELCGDGEKRLVIDHDHACCPAGKACGRCFRGMLCQPCNVALGMLKENPELLRSAAAYIERHRERIAT